MFWQMNDALFAAQDTAAAADVDVGNLAVRVGLDRSAFNDCMVGGRVPASIRADLEAALEKRVEGTPTFFIGTTIFTGNLPPDALRSGVTRARRAPGP
jgi:protein-disulfide isomerase